MIACTSPSFSFQYTAVCFFTFLGNILSLHRSIRSFALWETASLSTSMPQYSNLVPHAFSAAFKSAHSPQAGSNIIPCLRWSAFISSDRIFATKSASLSGVYTTPYFLCAIRTSSISKFNTRWYQCPLSIDAHTVHKK